MAKIDTANGNIPIFNPAVYGNIKPEIKQTKDKGKVRSAREPTFDEILESELDEAIDPLDLPVSEEAIQRLLDGVHTAGDALKKRPFPEEIKRYKQAVRNFLNYVVDNAYSTEEQISGINPMRRKTYTIIQVVDQKLELLAAAILAGQSSQLDLLARVDEITGILVDLLQ